MVSWRGKVTGQTDSVTIEVKLPRQEYERVEAQARREHSSAVEMISRLIDDGLLSRMTAREIMERVSVEYRARIAASGVPELTSAELLEKLRRDREAIVDELYP